MRNGGAHGILSITVTTAQTGRYGIFALTASTGIIASAGLCSERFTPLDLAAAERFQDPPSPRSDGTGRASCDGCHGRSDSAECDGLSNCPLGRAYRERERRCRNGGVECDTVCGDLRDRHAEAPFEALSPLRIRKLSESRVGCPVGSQRQGAGKSPGCFYKSPARLRSRVRCGSHPVAISPTECARSSPVSGAHGHVSDLAKSASR